MKINKNELRSANMQHNSYYEKYHSCKKSWFWGAIVGTVLAIGLSLLIAECRLNMIFFLMLPFALASAIPVVAASLAVGYTRNFGLSCIPRGIMKFGCAGLNIFAGTYVLLGVGLFLMAMAACGFVFALLVFTFLFPVETLYYLIRYKIEEAGVKKMLKQCRQ